MRSAALTAATVSVALSVAGCCGSHRVAVPPPPPFIPTTIAILPFDNATASIDAPKIQRQALQDRIKKKGYVPIPQADIDRMLGELGVQLAGQLQVTSYDELREKLRADVMITGKMLQVSALKVEAEIQFVDLRTKQVVMTTKRWVPGLADDTGSGVEGLAVALAVGAISKYHTAQGKLADQLIGEIPWCPREQPRPPPTPPPPPAMTLDAESQK